MAIVMDVFAIIYLRHYNKPVPFYMESITV